MLVAAGCGGRPEVAPAPETPEATVRQFMSAVSQRNLRAMSELWGDQRGPAIRTMNQGELEQRLTIMRQYLQHERYELVVDNMELSVSGDRRTINVRLFRRGCEPAVPFTLTRYRGGWLISNVDLGAAGNPQRSCVRRG